MNSNPSSGLVLIAYLVAVTWAVTQSNKRWKTVLYTVLGLVATLAVFFVLTLIWPDMGGVLGHLAVIPMYLVSALVGINHMRANRRASAPKPQ